MLLHLPDWPVSQALALLKDQTLCCLFITLIPFSTWLYYLLRLLWERQLQTVVDLFICFLPLKVDASTRASLPRSPHSSILRAPLGTGEMFKQGLAPLSAEEGSLGAQEKAMPNDAKGSPATGWPEGTVAVLSSFSEN